MMTGISMGEFVFCVVGMALDEGPKPQSEPTNIILASPVAQRNNELVAERKKFQSVKSNSGFFLCGRTACL